MGSTENPQHHSMKWYNTARVAAAASGTELPGQPDPDHGAPGALVNVMTCRNERQRRWRRRRWRRRWRRSPAGSASRQRGAKYNTDWRQLVYDCTAPADTAPCSTSAVSRSTVNSLHPLGAGSERRRSEQTRHGCLILQHNVGKVIGTKYLRYVYDLPAEYIPSLTLDS